MAVKVKVTECPDWHCGGLWHRGCG